MFSPHNTFCAHGATSEPITFDAVTPDVSHHVPGAADVSNLAASASAPAALTSPAPCVSGSYATPLSSCSWVAVNSRIALSALGRTAPATGLAVRLASITSAATPLTIPADMLVPLRRIHLPEVPAGAVNRQPGFLLHNPPSLILLITR